MHGLNLSKILVIITLITLTGCMDAGDRGLGPACQSNLVAAERDLKSAKANSIGTVINWARAATLIGAARTQQQFNEFQNCVIKAKRAREIISIRN